MHRAPHPAAGRPPATDDSGFALITTVLVIAMLAAFSLVALRQSIDATGAARKDQDWVAALGAAQAGIDDYINRLNASNGSYALTPEISASSGIGAGNWAPVAPATATEAPRAHYHLDINTDTYLGTATVAPNGAIEVTSTGKVGARTRTLKASVRRSAFLDFVYFTDLETPDPLTYDTPAQQDAAAGCAVYYTSTSPARPLPVAPSTAPICRDIAFTGDTLKGPVHSNDTMLICNNNTFEDSVTTASPVISGTNAYRTNYLDSAGVAQPCGPTNTTFKVPGDPRRVERISMPATNLVLKRETSSTTPAPRGCLYVGPTKIVIRGTDVKVTSPWTKVTTATCKKDDWMPIPANGVIYVDVVPAVGTVGDGNAPSASEVCPAGGSNGVGYPVTGSTGLTENGWRYPCKAGDVFIEQEGGLAANGLKGRLTVAANNDIYITDHIDHGNTSSFLGLIAEQFLYVWHPVHRTSVNPPVGTNLRSFTNPRIAAAMLSLNHAVTVQNHAYGDHLGTLNVKGALISKFRGRTSATTGGVPSGYAKNYTYDQRLRYDGPPRFLNPSASTFVAARTAEAPALYR